MGGRAPHPQAARRAERTRHAAAQPGDSGVPRERARHGGASASAIAAAPRVTSSRRSSSIPTRRRPTSISATCGCSQAISRAPMAAWDRLIDAVARARLPGASIASSGSTSSEGAAAEVRRALPRASSPQSAGLARAPGAGPPPGRAAIAHAKPSSSCFAALEQNPHGLTVHQAVWNVLLKLDLESRARAALHRVGAIVGVLPRSARLPQVPLPQHRAAVAVPALSRMEFVRRRTHRPRQGRPRSRCRA